MKIEVPDIGEIEVKDITYGQARELHRANAKAFWGKAENEVDPDKYYDLLEKVLELSGLGEKELSEFSMVQVDVILQQTLMEYTGLNVKS